MAKKFYGLSNGYVFQHVFQNLKSLNYFTTNVYDFDLSGYRYINSEFSKVSTNECVLTLTNGKQNVLVHMETKKLDGFKNDVVFFINNVGPITYKKVNRKYPTIILGIKRYI